MNVEARYLVTERFYVDRRSETLVVDGSVVALHHRSYEVLLALMAKPKALVSKRELFDRIWGTLDVSDAVLTTAIKELRQALGDDARDPWAVATVHARGYRLLLRVHACNQLDLPDEKNGEPQASVRFSRALPIAAAIAIVSVGIALFTLNPESRRASDRQAGGGQRSVAVLPFQDLSLEGDQKWFADGLAEEILNSLAQSKDLLVAARTSSFRYGGGSTPDIREIADALDVTHVMEGSVRKGADQLRVTAQLIRAEDGFHVWSRTYDIPVDTDNALTLQEDIANDVLSAMHADTHSSTTIMGEPTLPLEQFEQFLRSRQLVTKRQPESVLQGLKELNQLVQRAPDFAPGHAWLAYAYLFSTQFSGHPLAESITAAQLHVSRAMALDPESADTLNAAALLEMFRSNFDAAFEFADLAVAANPNNVHARRRRGVAQLGRGHARAAHEDFMAVRARDPLSSISLAHVSSTYSILNDIENSLEAAREGVRWNPEDALANGNLGRILADVGHYREAFLYLEKSVAINPDTGSTTLALATLYWRLGLDDRLDFAEEGMIWTGLAAAAFSVGDPDRGLELARIYDTAYSGTLYGIHFYHWYADTALAYAPAMRLADRDELAESGLADSYRRGAIPAMLALEANDDPQGAIIRSNLEALFAQRLPGDYFFARDIYGAASWHMVNGNSKQALSWLRDALDKGLVFRELHLDPIWDGLRDSGEFNQIVTAMDERAAEIRESLISPDRGDQRSADQQHRAVIRGAH